MQDFLRVYKLLAYKTRRLFSERSWRTCHSDGAAPLMHGPSTSLYTAKDFIHPQFPQGYPHVHRAKTPHFPGFPRLYPHRPQVIHSRYPQRFPVWIFMWTFTISCFYLFTHVHICIFMHVRVCSRCFTCFIRALQTPDFPCPKQTNVTKTSNPQRLSAPLPSFCPQKKAPCRGLGSSSGRGMGDYSAASADSDSASSAADTAAALSRMACASSE